MRTYLLRTAGILGLACCAGLSAPSGASAQSVTSDESAGFIVLPRIVSDANDIFDTNTTTNTVVQLTNTSGDPVTVHCFYINATGTCSTGNNAPGAGTPTVGSECRDASDCAGVNPSCVGQCSAADFTITLSPQQPVGWVVEDGIVVAAPGTGGVPPINTDYFTGELKCIQVNDNVSATPVNSNDLQASATIYRTGANDVDVSSYNAIGIQAVEEDGSAQNDKTMCLGGTGVVNDECEDAEYAACPAKLILDHFFEGAAIAGGNNVSTSVTLVPCSEDIATQTPTALVVQYLVFNEFEQRMSGATELECLATLGLEDLGRIFDVTVQGTLAGQTHLRPVDTTGTGVGLLGIAEEDIEGASTAFHLNSVGEGGPDAVEYVFPLVP